MAMVTEDIVLDYGDGWIAIVNTGTKIHISNITGNHIMCRFGIGSSSKGFEMSTDDTLSCEETIFVKPSNIFGATATVTVTRG
jgi:hypothetical protein